MADWPDGHDIGENSLQLGDELGGGGQGTVWSVNGWAVPLAYKQYTSPGADGMALQALVSLPTALTPSERNWLLRDTSWPLARVMRGGQVSGFLMQEIPGRFFGPDRTGRPKLRELQFLLFPMRPMWETIVSAEVTADLRVSVAAQCAQLFCLLHGKSLVIGDVSMKNIMWAPGTPAQVFFIDCDSFRPSGNRPVFPQPSTPDWDDPQHPGQYGADLTTDRYKLALLVGRILACHDTLRPGKPLTLPAEIPDRIAVEVTELWDRAAGPRDTRPDAAQWLRALTLASRDWTPVTRPPIRQPVNLGKLEFEPDDRPRQTVNLPPRP
jgi:DNA-binding helix-hairpin-helix protein with protein kinase domain